MEWRAEGTVIARRPHGETAIILDVLTLAHGRHAGVVPGGASARRAAMWQPGARLDLRWRARQADQLGSFAAEPVRMRAGLMADPTGLAALNAICALLVHALPERDPHPRLVGRTEALLDLIEAGGDWPAQYLAWELLLLEEMGLGLDLSACAVTGRRDDLAYVSPRSGRAVSRAAAGDWADRLLPLPGLLGGTGDADGDSGGDPGRDLAQGLALTGHFLDRGLAQDMQGRPLPAARARLVGRLLRGASMAEAPEGGAAPRRVPRPPRDI